MILSATPLDADRLFDAAALRALVVEVVREELRGELVADVLREELRGSMGERMTTNLRRIVRREVLQALAGRHEEADA
jgi:hypothetical protein